MRHLWKTVTMLFFVLGLYLPSLFAQTDCNTPTPYTQDFEAVADYSLPDCWSQVNPFDGGYPAVESYQPHEGSKALRFRTYQTPQLAVMPTFTQPLNTLQISFWTRRENTNSGTFSVGYVTDINSANSFVPVWSRTAAQMSNNNYQFFTVSFEDVAVDPSLNYRIAFRYEASSAFITFNGNTDYGDEMTFTTIPGGVEPNPCDVPTSLHATDIQNESITIAWDANAGVVGWNIRYRAADAIPWTTATSATNSLTVTPLIGHTDYEFQVQADCGDGNLSDWSGSVIVQTSNVGLENWLESNLTLFPNPTKEVVNVQWTMDNVQFGNVELQLVDAYGRLLDVVGANNYSPLQTAQINLSRYATGIYFVKAVVDGKTVAVRKVVRN